MLRVGEVDAIIGEHCVHNHALAPEPNGRPSCCVREQFLPYALVSSPQTGDFVR